MAKLRIKKGDTVQVISGSKENKGKTGRVITVFPDTQRVLVEGINRRTHHVKPNQAGGAGGIEQREASIHVSNVALVDPEDNKPTKIGYRVETLELENGRTKQVRVRFAKRSGKDI